jgi:hypothetical protein
MVSLSNHKPQTMMPVLPFDYAHGKLLRMTGVVIVNSSFGKLKMTGIDVIHPLLPLRAFCLSL